MDEIIVKLNREELITIINSLMEIPAKYSIDLILKLKSKLNG